MSLNSKKINASLAVTLGLASTLTLAGLTSAVSATGVSGNVQLNTEVSTSIAMKIASPNDTNPDCMEQSGVTYGVANRYATSNGAEGSKQVDTFDGTPGGADELNTNTSCATLTMNPNAFSSTYSDITIYTNSPNGYSLTVRSADNTSPNLVNTTDPTQYIEAGTLTESNGTTPGGQNKWALKSDTGLLDTWTPVATTDTTVRSYDQETDHGSTTRVTYGISAGNNVTGKYATTLTYTATMFDGENTTIPSADITADDDAYKIDGASGGTIKVPYNETRAVTISPTAGYYLTGITCTSPYTCGDINGDPLVIPANNTNPVTVYITNTSKTESGTIIISTTAIEYPVSVAGDPENEASSLNTSTSNLSIPYGSYRTVTVAPAIGYYLDSVNCPDGYSCTVDTTTGSTDNHNNAGSTNGANKTTGSASPLILGNNAYATGEGAGSGTGTGTESPVQTGEDVTYAQDVKVKNDKATKGGALTFATKPRNFTVSISSDSDLTTTSGSSSETIDSLTIIYGHSKNITVTPAAGHYLASISCPEGYVCTKTDGTAISTGNNEAARAPQNIRISNDRSTTGGTLTLTSGTSEYTVSASATNATVSTASLSIPYGGSKTLTVTPATGYYLSSYSCPEGYTCTKEDNSAISTGDNATAQAAQTIKVTNNNTASGGSLTFTGVKRNLEVAITPSINATTSTNLLSIPYGGSSTFTITPNTGYYLTGVTCSSGYTCSGYTTGSAADPNATSRGAQTITVTNNSTTSTGAVSFTLDNKYRISFSKTNMSSPSASYVDVAYGGQTTVTVTPASGYYLSGVTCPTGFTCTGYTTDKSDSASASAQTITVTNNNTNTASTLAFAATKLIDGYMQDFSVSAHSGDATGTTYTLADSRDEKEYAAKKLADGNIWMMANLELDLPSGQTKRTLTPADSDVAANWDLEDTNNWCSQVECESRKLISRTGYTNSQTAPTYYYNWYTATAGTGTSSLSSGEANSSICPKGWKLPTVTQFRNLDKAYGGTGVNRSSDAAQATNFINNVGFGFTGYRAAATVHDAASGAYYWSRSVNSAIYAYNLTFTSSNKFYPEKVDRKWYGYAVRCVAAS